MVYWIRYGETRILLCVAQKRDDLDFSGFDALLGSGPHCAVLRERRSFQYGNVVPNFAAGGGERPVGSLPYALGSWPFL